MTGVVMLHEYVPDAMAMGDCRVCGHVMNADVHKVGISVRIDPRDKRIAELEAALEPFASMSDSYDDDPAAHVIASKRGTILSVYDLRIAKASITKS